MNLGLPRANRRGGGANGRTGGAALIVVVVMLGVIAVLLVANAQTLARFKESILLIENKQLQKYRPLPANRPENRVQPIPAQPVVPEN